MLVMADSDAEARHVAFGNALRQALRVKGMTQEELAEAIGRKQPMISGWINGKRSPETTDLAFEVERAIGVDPGTLTVHLGYLPPEAVRTVASFESVLLADPGLNDDEKEMLLAGYRAAKKRRNRRGRPPKDS